MLCIYKERHIIDRYSDGKRRVIRFTVLEKKT